ncbi:MAG TPA: hypothetical protein PLZ43_09190 [bacterium]|nr:hypothetical protein [bacterium]
MRAIDSKAYNKRLHSEILQLDAILKKISPENVKFFDANLIGTAESYVKLLSDSTWAGNSNISGIEMNKVSSLLSYCESSKKQIFVNRIVSQHKTFNEVFVDGATKLEFPDMFDGRNSFVYARMVLFDPSNHKSIMKPLERGTLQDGGSLIVRKNATSVDVEFKYVHFEDLTYYKFYLDIFYIMWR